MVDSYRAMVSSLCKYNHTSWYVEPNLEFPMLRHIKSEALSNPNPPKPAHPGSIELETTALLRDMTLCHQRPQLPFSRKAPHTKPSSKSGSPKKTHVTPIFPHADPENGEDERGGGWKGSEAPDSDQINLSPGEFHLPRSSPVISRHRKPLAGGEAAPSSSVSCLLNSGFPLHMTKNLGLTNKQPEHDTQPRSCSDKDLRQETQGPFNRRSSDIPQCSVDIFRSSFELEQENVHFIVVDLVLEVLESAKWTLSLDRCSCARRPLCARQHSNTQSETCGAVEYTHTDARKHARHNCELTAEQKLEDVHRIICCCEVDINTERHTTSEGEEDTPEREHGKSQAKTLSLLSTDSGFEECGVEKMLTKSSLRRSLRCPMMHSGVERLAQLLVLAFRRSWLPSQQPQRGRHSLRTSLQELPGTDEEKVNAGRRSLMEEVRLRTRMRGSWSWAPPRFQIIFTVQPTHRRSEVVASQHFLCAGCGTEVEPRYIKKLRYCEYLARYFCDCCHGGSEAVIPGRVLSHWDFSRHPVSDFSKQLLDSVWSQPLYELTSVGKKLYGKVRELEKFRELQEQLLCTRKLLAACRLSDEVMREFDQLPGHLTQQPHLFSMEDLLRCKRGQMVPQARALLTSAIAHIENCVLCLARGFICELCKENDILFAFQRDKCKQCTECKACYHKECLMGKKCPKCARIQSRRQLLK